MALDSLGPFPLPAQGRVVREGVRNTMHFSEPSLRPLQAQCGGWRQGAQRFRITCVGESNTLKQGTQVRKKQEHIVLPIKRCLLLAAI